MHKEEVPPERTPNSFANNEHQRATTNGANKSRSGLQCCALWQATLLKRQFSQVKHNCTRNMFYIFSICERELIYTNKCDEIMKITGTARAFYRHSMYADYSLCRVCLRQDASHATNTISNQSTLNANWIVVWSDFPSGQMHSGWLNTCRSVESMRIRYSNEWANISSRMRTHESAIKMALINGSYD